MIFFRMQIQNLIHYLVPIYNPENVIIHFIKLDILEQYYFIQNRI